MRLSYSWNHSPMVCSKKNKQNKDQNEIMLLFCLKISTTFNFMSCPKRHLLPPHNHHHSSISAIVSHYFPTLSFLQSLWLPRSLLNVTEMLLPQGFALVIFLLSLSLPQIPICLHPQLLLCLFFNCHSNKVFLITIFKEQLISSPLWYLFFCTLFLIFLLALITTW